MAWELKDVLVSLVVCSIVSVNCTPLKEDVQPEVHEELEYDDSRGPGRPLFLTPYIEQELFREARNKASVKPFVHDVTSYAGYLTVNKKYNSNLFFWYFESENNPEKDPTVVWLQGGPGSSSLFGLFVENGPYVIGKKKIHKRLHTWSKISNIIFFDNPVGTGYSFTDDEAGYARNETDVGRDLYAALIQLYKLFPYLQKNELFVTGESYAGKYVPALGHTIHWENKRHPQIRLNLQGLMIGNGFTDPQHMLKYSKYLYQLGLIDDATRDKFHRVEKAAFKRIKVHNWKKAGHYFDLLVGDEHTLYYKYTRLTSYYNYVNVMSGYWYDYQQKFITGNRFRRAVHVGNTTYSDGVKVAKYLYQDMSKSVIHWVAELLNHYKVVFYNGQLDIICAYPLTVSYLRKMKWSLSREYKRAERHPYVVKRDIAGYYKTVGNLTEVLIRNAGHMVPADQPEWAFQLLSDFLHNNIGNATVSESNEVVPENSSW